MGSVQPAPASADPASFRDPSGTVYRLGGRILRTVVGDAADHFEHLRDTGLLKRLAGEGWIVDTDEVDPAVLGTDGQGARHVVEHPCLTFISYPYEWSFPMLKAAALHHLDLHLMALDHGATLSDASAYNIQFAGSRPIFIDVLALRRYRDGEFWLAHRQFCEQFLNPLLLRAALGLTHNAWFRGTLEGIPTGDLNRLLPLRRKLSWNVLSHVVLPARLHASSMKKQPDVSRLRQRTLPYTAFRGMLIQLRGWIAKLQPAETGRSVWGDYTESHTYMSDEDAAKRRFVDEFVRHTRPGVLWDLGCNTGEYASVALEAGAGQVIGFDFDQGALERAFTRAQAQHLNFLPLFLDAANPSPGQGWNGAERQSLQSRANADAILALAFEHHLAIGRNIPLRLVTKWLTDLAPCGVIEFVRKDDPTVQQMLALRDDVFDDYDEEGFAAALRNHARVVRSETVSSTGRKLFWYMRT